MHIRVAQSNRAFLTQAICKLKLVSRQGLCFEPVVHIVVARIGIKKERIYWHHLGSIHADIAKTEDAAVHQAEMFEHLLLESCGLSKTGCQSVRLNQVDDSSAFEITACERFGHKFGKARLGWFGCQD